MESNQSPPKSIAHILHLLRFQLVLEFTSEPVSLKFETPADGVHSHSDNGFHRHKDHLEQNERQNRRGLGRDVFREVERSEKPWGVDEGGEESEDREDVDLRNDEELGRVHVVPVTELVSWRGIRDDKNRSEDLSSPRTASTSSALLCLIRVSKMTICLLYKSMNERPPVTSRSATTHGRPKK